jgi:hypothetical protein
MTTVRTTPAAEGDLTYMTPRKKWFKVGMRAPILLTGDTRYRRGPISSVVNQNSVVVTIDGTTHAATRVLGKNRFEEV